MRSPGLSDPEWYPGHKSIDSYYADYWDRYPEPPIRGMAPVFPAFPYGGYPSDPAKPVVFNGDTYDYY